MISNDTSTDTEIFTFVFTKLMPVNLTELICDNLKITGVNGDIQQFSALPKTTETYLTPKPVLTIYLSNSSYL